MSPWWNDDCIHQVASTSEVIVKRVLVGARVTLEETETGERREYTLVPAPESDAARGLIAVASPVGKAVLQRTVGDEVTVRLPRGQRSYEIVEIS